MKKISLLIITILLATNVYAAAPTRPYTYVSNNIIDPVQNNANENTLYSYLQTGVDTYSPGSITGSDISGSASIPYVSLSLSNSIVNADINSSAGIVYSKLSLSNSILATDIKSTEVFALANIPTIPLATGVSGVLPVANGGTGTSGNLFGTPVSKSTGTIYQAATNGIVEVTSVSNSANGSLSGYTDSSTPPTTLRAVCESPSLNSGMSITFVVLKGDYYTVTASSATGVMVFIPIGS